MAKGGIRIKCSKAAIKIKSRGIGADAATAGFREVVEQFDQFKTAYDDLDAEERAELESALGEDLATALKDGSKNQFESEVETLEDVNERWAALKNLLDIEAE